MRFTGWHRALAAAALLLASSALAAQDAPPRPPIEITGGGTELFRGLLDHHGIKPISKSETRKLNRFDDVILISLGNPFAYTDEMSALDRLEETSTLGSALNASDTQLHLNSSLRRPHGIRGPRVECL